MTKFRGFNNSVIHVKRRGLNRPQVKQVQKIIQRNKRIKNAYVKIGAPGFSGFNLAFTDAATATPSPTAFGELTLTNQGDNSFSRSELEIQLQSYNIKLGLDWYLNDATMSTDLLQPAPFRVIIVRSKQGPQTDIVNVANIAIATMWDQPDPDRYQVYTDEIISVSGDPANSTNITPGYLWHFYKSFKNKKVPHMIVGYQDDGGLTPTAAINNPIYIKVIMSSNAPAAGNNYNFQLTGFCHLKFFDKE